VSAAQGWYDELEALLPAARAGSAPAKNRVWELADLFLGNGSGAIIESGYQSKCSQSELRQITLLQGWIRFEQFRGENAASFVRWLLEIRRTQYLNVVEKLTTASRDVRREVSELSHGSASVNTIASNAPTPSAEAVANEDHAAIYAALATLSKDDQCVLQLRLFDKKEFAEIGQALGRSTEAARKQFARAFARLSALLEPAS
jgi:RNA polymerase sigma factor (sigma-70 family)